MKRIMINFLLEVFIFQGSYMGSMTERQKIKQPLISSPDLDCHIQGLSGTFLPMDGKR